MPKSTKSQTVQRLMVRPNGVSLQSLCAKTGLQPHSVRAFASGLRKAGAVVKRDGCSPKAKYRLMPHDGVQDDPCS
mgnify:CR=1 FL=1